jgi:hypothetical protein
MHQYKTVAQILLLLSIFNLVLGVPVVREIYDARDNGAVPVVARNVVVMSKERSQVDSDMPTPSHSSPPPQDGSTPLYASSPSDGDASLHGSPTPPGGLVSLAVSSPPDEIVPGTDRPPVRTTPMPHGYTAAMRTHVPLAEDPATRAEMVETLSKKAAIGTSVLIIAGVIILEARRLSHNHHHRTIDPDWYVLTPPTPFADA